MTPRGLSLSTHPQYRKPNPGVAHLASNGQPFCQPLVAILLKWLHAASLAFVEVYRGFRGFDIADDMGAGLETLCPHNLAYGD